MQLLISGEMTIKEVNKSFQKEFPYLKLEFYNNDPVPEQVSQWNDRLHEKTKLRDIGGNFLTTIIQFVSTETVGALEQKFREKLGLFMKVYYKLNGVWQQSSQSGHLALDKQNALGSRPFRAGYNVYTLYL